jgi:hypothetical protein
MVINVMLQFAAYAVSYEFVPSKPFQPSAMFVGKAKAYPIEEPFRCSTLV